MPFILGFHWEKFSTEIWFGLHAKDAFKAKHNQHHDFNLNQTYYLEGFCEPPDSCFSKSQFAVNSV